MRRALLNSFVALCVGSFSISASAQSGALAAATLAVAPIDPNIVEGTTRDRVFALLGQPWIVDRANDRWVYPTQTVMFKNDLVIGILDSDASRVTAAADAKKSTTKTAAKRKYTAKRKPATTARKGGPVRKSGYSQGPFNSVKNRYFKKIDRPEMMGRGSARRSYSPVYSPYQAGRYGHNLNFGNGKRIVARRTR